MNHFLSQLRAWLPLPISKRQAARIAAEAAHARVDQLEVLGKKPTTLNVYNAPTELCWYVYAPWGDDLDDTMLRSSRIIFVSRTTGRVVYDGSANDEG